MRPVGAVGQRHEGETSRHRPCCAIAASVATSRPASVGRRRDPRPRPRPMAPQLLAAGAEGRRGTLCRGTKRAPWGDGELPGRLYGSLRRAPPSRAGRVPFIRPLDREAGRRGLGAAFGGGVPGEGEAAGVEPRRVAAAPDVAEFCPRAVADTPRPRLVAQSASGRPVQARAPVRRGGRARGPSATRGRRPASGRSP